VPKEHYRDLVFSPLDLPDPPAIDAAALIAWMEWARPRALQRGLNRPERGYEARTGKRYPWLMTTLRFTDPGATEESFEREFPTVVDFTRLFPLNGLRLLVLLAQRERAAVHLHSDSDGAFGFRFYLTNAHREGLYFCMARPGVGELPRYADDWAPFLDLERRHYVRWPAANTPYCLNSARAAHAVDANACALGERIACLAMPEHGLDEERLLVLLEASTARYRAYQIWHPGR
jgi:hypothetical protein